MNSPQYVIREKWSHRKYALAIAGIVSLCVLLLSAGYFVGNYHSLSLIENNQQLSQDIISADAKIDALEKQLIMQEQINKVEQAANSEAGQTLDQQLQTIRALERELTFYRNILAPEESQRGLQISQFTQQPISEDRVGWQVSLLQAGSQGQMMSGLATVDLIYLSDGIENREQILNSSGNREFGFKFRYFQHLNGEITLTQNRQPVALEVTARQYGPNSNPVVKRFDWTQPIEETIAHVGQ